MDRRRAIASLWAAPLVALAQPRQSRPFRIGVLGATTAVGYAGRWENFRAGLRDLGLVEGRDIVLEYRFADGNLDRLPNLAIELVSANVDVIVTHGIPGTRAAKQVTATIPIVMAIVTDPVSAGLVTALARPGGNVTGSAYFAPELAAKRLELLKQFNPRAALFGVLTNPDNPLFSKSIFEGMEPTANSLGVRLQAFEARTPAEFDMAFAAMAKQRVDAVAVLEEAMLNANAISIARLADRQKLPSIGNREFAEAGGLIGYGADFPELFRNAARIVARVIKGDRAGDIAIAQATKFDLIVNLATAKSIGVVIPQSLILRADQTI